MEVRGDIIQKKESPTKLCRQRNDCQREKASEPGRKPKSERESCSGERSRGRERERQRSNAEKQWKEKRNEKEEGGRERERKGGFSESGLPLLQAKMASNSAVKEGGVQMSLLALQSRMKCDPSGYEDELLLQLRHFEACLSVFHIHSSSKTVSNSFATDHNAAKELADMAMFLAHVTPVYPQHLRQFPQQILGLLQSKGDSLQPVLRRQLAQALILLRNRQMIELVEILPLLMDLQTLGEKALRKLAFLHIVQDVRRINLKHKNVSKNRPLQNVLFNLLQDERESRSKRSLIILCELHRRKLWDDERTANAICSACFHPSSKILKAALSFLLGYEKVDEEDEVASEEEEDEHKPTVALSREAMYKAHHKGTMSSRKKKQAKLQRAMRSLKKQQRSQMEGASGSFSPLQQLHDPQGFAEKLFSRLQSSNERFEVKLMLMKVISRTIGLHRLILLNFYPFLQKYVQPHQSEITHVLAAAVQACHDMVPPDAVEFLLRQLVNQFVHDRARPEVIAVGLNVVREMCMRMPLIMTRELLTDLALYKKSREKAVSSAARSIVAIFRQVFPLLLEKKDRGKNADLLAKPKAFGEKLVSSSVPGIELLACNDRELLDSSHSEGEGSKSDSDDDCNDTAKEVSELVSSFNGDEEDEEEEKEADSDSDAETFGSERSSDYTQETDSEEDSDDEEAHLEDVGTEDCKRGVSNRNLKRKNNEEEEPASKRVKSSGLDGKSANCSLRELKKIFGNRSQDDSNLQLESRQDGDGILSDSDFQHIKRLQAKKAARNALANAGMGKSKKKEEDVKIPSSEHIHERRVNPAMLEAKIRRRREKEERLVSVRFGQEEREAFKSRTSLKQKKSGGLSNRQKEKKKSLPLAAKLAKASKSRIQKRAHRQSTKQFRGRKAWK